MIEDLYGIVAKVKRAGPKRVVVAQAEEEEVLLALAEAVTEQIAQGILVGDLEKIRVICGRNHIKPDNFTIIDSDNGYDSALRCCELIREGQAEVIMKGAVPTKDFMRAILDKEQGLATGGLLSHVAVFELKSYPKLLLITDAAVNIAPTLLEKVQILKNAVEVAHSLGIETPRVGCVAPVEFVNPEKMPSTVEAACLTMMNRRGQIRGCIVDGPLALDNIISKEAAITKGIESEIPGEADIILVPEIESGNILYKSLTIFAGARCASILVGAKAPVVLTSRSDSHETKLMSIALAAVSVK